MIRNRSVPDVSVIPVLGYPDVGEAVEWLVAAFGFRERLRIADHRAQLVHRDGAIVVSRAAPGAAASASESVLVRVEDADRHAATAAAHGATILSPPADYEFGERQYTARDPAGHVWTFSQSIADSDPASWGGRLVDAGADGDDGDRGRD
jgi:uncharacterized glyoxalase superfamily protein PhnB